jgi:lipid II:glycine glycyltransferase (peptidoglycan interpeptide bridge formation enzyme)
MAQIIVRGIQDKKEWEGFIAKHKEANFLHSWHWGEFHERLGKTIHRTGFFENEKLIGVMLSIVESAKRGRYLTIPGGPIIDWKNKHLVHTVFLKMRNIADLGKCSFVRVRPQLIEDKTSIKIFRENGSKKSPMHLTADLTHQLDLSKTEEKLLADMRKGTRHDIRKAEKLGIKISTSTDEKLIKKFYNLQLVTAKRQKFVPFSYEFFRKQFNVFFDENLALIYTASFNKKVLAQAFIIFYNTEAVYHYGVSTEEGRKYPGACLIQWEAIKEAKRRGLSKYNFWGVAPTDSKNHRFAGVSLFKRGFGGEDIQYLHAHDLVIHKRKYFFTYLFEILRKTSRKV